MVASVWQGLGLGTAMLQRLIAHAIARDLRGLIFEILRENERMLGVVNRHYDNIRVEHSAEQVSITLLFESASHGGDEAGHGSPSPMDPWFYPDPGHYADQIC